MNFYAHEKIRKLEEERLARHALPPPDRKPPGRRPAIFGSMAAHAGRTLCRLGEGLEAWSGRLPAKPDDASLGLDQRQPG